MLFSLPFLNTDVQTASPRCVRHPIYWTKSSLNQRTNKQTIGVIKTLLFITPLRNPHPVPVFCISCQLVLRHLFFPSYIYIYTLLEVAASFMAAAARLSVLVPLKPPLKTAIPQIAVVAVHNTQVRAANTASARAAAHTEPRQKRSLLRKTASAVNPAKKNRVFTSSKAK